MQLSREAHMLLYLEIKEMLTECANYRHNNYQHVCYEAVILEALGD